MKIDGQEMNREYAQFKKPATKLDIERLEKRIAALEPVKKTEKETKFLYRLEFTEIGVEDLYSKKLKLTPTAADKLSEAISALVEYMTAEGDYASQEASDLWKRVCSNADVAREFYQGSQ